jgi:hypothetical protein
MSCILERKKTFLIFGHWIQAQIVSLKEGGKYYTYKHY